MKNSTIEGVIPPHRMEAGLFSSFGRGGVEQEDRGYWMMVLLGAGILLGVLLLLAAAVLWVPVRYTVSAEMVAHPADAIPEAEGLQAESSGESAGARDLSESVQKLSPQFELQVLGCFHLVQYIVRYSGQACQTWLCIFGRMKKLAPPAGSPSSVSLPWKNRLPRFWQTPGREELYPVTVRALRQLVEIIKPQRARGWLEYGFLDPSYTGYAFGLWCVGNHFLQTEIEVLPNFQAEILQGHLEISGRFRLGALLILAFQYSRIPVVRHVFQKRI